MFRKKGYDVFGRRRAYSMEEVRDLIEPVAVEYGAKVAYVYGPYARGEADGNSKVDILMIFKAPLGLSYGGVYMDLMKAFDGRMSLASNGSNPEFLRSIEPEKVPVYVA